MEIKEVKDEKLRAEWNILAHHPLQAWEWGEFRAKTGVKTVRYGLFNKGKLAEPIQVTIHPIPHTPWTIGYYPKGNKLTEEHVKAFKLISKKYNCIFIKCEPKTEGSELNMKGFVKGRSLFTKYNFVLDVTPSEETLLKQMKQKTRYNIRVAEKKGVTVEIDNSEEAFDRYLQLTKETTARQGFYAHGENYHRKMWETIRQQISKPTNAGRSANQQKVNDGKRTYELKADLLTAKYRDEIITTWVLFRFGDTLYYPYGASTREHREVMANNLVMWEAIKLARKWNLRYLDMWGALGPEPDKNDPWFGFHTFKAGYGARHVKYIGTYDWVAKPAMYHVYRAAEHIRWAILRIIK